MKIKCTYCIRSVWVLHVYLITVNHIYRKARVAAATPHTASMLQATASRAYRNKIDALAKPHRKLYVRIFRLFQPFTGCYNIVSMLEIIIFY